MSYFIIYIYFFSFLSYFWGRGGLSWLGLGQFSKPWKRKVKKFQSSTTIELHSRRRLLCLTSLGYCFFLLLLLLVVVLRVNNFCLFPMIILNMFKNLCWTFFFLFQEVDKFQDLEQELKLKGYHGIWKVYYNDLPIFFFNEMNFSKLYCFHEFCCFLGETCCRT